MAKAVSFSFASTHRFHRSSTSNHRRCVTTLCSSPSSTSTSYQNNTTNTVASTTRRSLLTSTTLGLAATLMNINEEKSSNVSYAYDSYDKTIKKKENGTTSIGIQDMREKNAGVQLIYEARDIDLPLKDRYLYSRDGEAGKQLSPEETLSRVNDAKDRINSEVRVAIEGQDWAKARNALRGRVGFLRFDLNYLVSLKDKEAKKEAIKLKTNALQKIEDLDYQLRLKNQETATGKIEIALAELDKAISFLK